MKPAPDIIDYRKYEIFAILKKWNVTQHVSTSIDCSNESYVPCFLRASHSYTKSQIIFTDRSPQQIYRLIYKFQTSQKELAYHYKFRNKCYIACTFNKSGKKFWHKTWQMLSFHSSSYVDILLHQLDFYCTKHEIQINIGKNIKLQKRL